MEKMLVTSSSFFFPQCLLSFHKQIPLFEPDLFRHLQIQYNLYSETTQGK